jgi:hypothetical protein
MPIFDSMSIAADKVTQVFALPETDRTFVGDDSNQSLT